MFGWELPPYNSGGLGTASLGMTEGLSQLGVDIDFVLPKAHGPYPYRHMRIRSASDSQGASPLSAMTLPYGSYVRHDADDAPQVEHTPSYDTNAPYLHASWYASATKKIAQEQSFDLIHTHDWMTYYSGLQARANAKRAGRSVPMVAHIHATEFDRGGARGGNQAIAAIEQIGLQAADRVIAVSHYTARTVHEQYGVPRAHISVVHNGITPGTPPSFDMEQLKKHFKIVLFMGRITMSKGPEYFLKLAKAVTDKDPKIKFVMVGSGDMEQQCIELAARMGLTGKILFSSFLRGEDVTRAYQLADLFVMPSVSEPFGLVALEALQNGTPAIVSKQSGVAEVSKNLIQVDFWDTNKMADSVFQVLQHPDFADTLRQGGRADLHQLSWLKAAEKIQAIYQELLPVPVPVYA